ncbi:MAG: hypothetical protein RKO66_09720, partial [Candidatus Contendobacter sp.]|nr:hypothetical protein [Candidatus Contendobacter sp.]
PYATPLQLVASTGNLIEPAGNPEYDIKIKKKIQICSNFGITLISIYPSDLMSDEKIQRKLAPIFKKQSA